MKKLYFFLLTMCCFYNLKAQGWSKINPTPALSYGTSMVALPSSKAAVLFGGYDKDNDVWIFDGDSNKWEYQEHIIDISPYARFNHAMCYLKDDFILLFGGTSTSGIYFSDTWTYQFSNNSWEKIYTTGPSVRGMHSLCSLGNGQALLCGGMNAKDKIIDSWIFDFTSKQWTKLAIDATQGLWTDRYIGMCTLDKGMVFATSAAAKDSSVRNWIFDIKDSTWREITPKSTSNPKGVNISNLTQLANGEVILYGGIDSINQCISMWKFTLKDSSWTEIKQQPGSLSIFNFAAAICNLDSNRLLVFGGKTQENGQDKTCSYDLSTSKWTTHQSDVAVKPSPRPEAKSCYIGEDRILMFGGEPSMQTELFQDTWIYHLNDNYWEKMTPKDSIMPPQIWFHTMSYIGNNTAVVFGQSFEKNSLWVYKLDSNKWEHRYAKDSISPSIRNFHAMSYIGDDKVLLFGGMDQASGNMSDETWVYDLSENRWELKTVDFGFKPQACLYPTMDYIGNNKVIMHDGYNSGTTWIYNLIDNTWTLQEPKGGIYPEITADKSIIYLGAGKAMLFGGRNEESGTVETWIYDINKRSWTPSFNYAYPQKMSYAISGFGGNGKAMLFGGINWHPTNDYWLFEYDISSGIGDEPIAADSQLVIYPNPVSNTLNIIGAESEFVSIYSAMGEKVWSGTNEGSLDISHLPSGAYFARVMGKTVKFVKM